MRTHGVENVKDPGKWQMPGSNFRFTDIAASIGLVQLTKLEKRLERARSVYKKYRDGVIDLSAIQEIPICIGDGEVPVYNEFLVEDRSNLIKFLHANQIDTRPSYPDLHRADYLFQGQRNFPNSRIFADKGLVLPSGPDQSDGDIDRVIEMLASYYS
jgi:dTDP-4-amino-4,6-dideoxygalactose transaminase